METEAFYSLYPRWFLWTFVVAPVVVVLSSLVTFFALGGNLDVDGILCLLSIAFGLIIFVGGVNALRNLGTRPVVQVSDEAVEYGSVYAAPFARVRIEKSEVSRVLESGDKKVVVETRSGKRKRIPLVEVKRDERAAARRAIEQLFAAP